MLSGATMALSQVMTRNPVGAIMEVHAYVSLQTLLANHPDKYKRPLDI
jgi:hypothetical protein